MRRAARPIFDSYIVVDWSASAVPKRGRDSIWIACLGRAPSGRRRIALSNPPTRAEARAALEDRLSRALRAGRRTLIGFDFSYGYPAGTVRQLGIARPGAQPWRAMWDHLAALIEDARDNRNNRFAVAAALNRRLSGEAFPFWGCPPGAAGPFLTEKRGRAHGPTDPAEFRHADRQIAAMQPVWKLYTTGAVGSQTLMGLPILRALRDAPALREASLVWPFETGLRPLEDISADRWRILHAEMYLSLVPLGRRRGDEVLDAMQVRAHARHFAALDETGRLGAFFAGPPDLPAPVRAAVEAEEGWTLGVT